jgi:hypothetical protein
MILLSDVRSSNAGSEIKNVGKARTTSVVLSNDLQHHNESGNSE